MGFYHWAVTALGRGPVQRLGLEVPVPGPGVVLVGRSAVLTGTNLNSDGTGSLTTLRNYFPRAFRSASIIPAQPLYHRDA
eukprot:3203749-Rhodomonas_salina.1